MKYVHNGKTYRSKKFPMLEKIFFGKLEEGVFKIEENFSFTLRDVSDAYGECKIEEPTSISNTILDLTRQDRGIESRLPESIIELGYDLRKKTGPSERGNYCGEFVYVGVGETLHSWLTWKDDQAEELVVENLIPKEVLKYLSNDEGALFSAIDYCDLLSQALFKERGTVLRIQNPMKWQPNEIDGLYLWTKEDVIIAIEAKAVSTGDDINLEQMLGQYRTITSKRPDDKVMSVAAVMMPYGVNLTILEYVNNELRPKKFIKVKIMPEVESWQ